MRASLIRELGVARKSLFVVQPRLRQRSCSEMLPGGHIILALQGGHREAEHQGDASRGTSSNCERVGKRVRLGVLDELMVRNTSAGDQSARPGWILDGLVEVERLEE